ncbi:hypothetical protein CNR22_13415 [Sphingobacteriaceae bacterium]|nr:hypothetical protein CNR22_13415 [Sphingobacteriaceae bacterium]
MKSKKSIRPDPLDFFKKYSLVGSSKTIDLKKSKAKVCRYCSKNNTQTKFNQDTHLIPELLGENDTLTFDECDTCNKTFSNFESHLATFVRPYLTMLGVKGKKKIPKFHSRTKDRNEETRTILEHQEGNHKKLILQDLDDYRINHDEKTFDIIFRKAPFVPLRVYKSILKIGLSLLPLEDDKNNQRSFTWLNSDNVELAYVSTGFITSLTRTYFQTPWADLYQANKLGTTRKVFPKHTLILGFANQIVQIFLPFSNEQADVHTGKRPLDLILYPSFAFDKIEGSQTVRIKTFDLSVDHAVTEDQKMTFTYESAELNIPHHEIKSSMIIKG